MKLFSTIFFVFVLIVCCASIPAYYFWYKPTFKTEKSSFRNSITRSSEEYSRLVTKAISLKKFIAIQHYNSNICFIIDMNIFSGRNRFFVYDLQNDSILVSGLVAHGSCDNGFQVNAKFSNRVNSGCSCLGNFKIGESYQGRFGLAYKLFGLDSSNSNAFNRTIVLHSYDCVPGQEIYPLPLCNSRGCPMVSPLFLQQLKSYLDNSGKPVLLTIFR